MVTEGLLVKLEAKPGKEEAVASFLRVPRRHGQAGSPGGTRRRGAEVEAAELLSEPPRIDPLDVLAAKLPH